MATPHSREMGGEPEWGRFMQLGHGFILAAVLIKAAYCSTPVQLKPAYVNAYTLTAPLAVNPKGVVFEIKHLNSVFYQSVY